MKLLICFCLIAYCEGNKIFFRGRSKGGNLGTSWPTEERHNLPKDEWFQQQRNHFNPTDQNTWKQRFFTNASFYKPGGPVFLMIGGEGKASPKWMVEGAWINYAEKFNALCFQVEHRYYGDSHPTETLSVKNLVYLTSEQALADLAYFIEQKSIEFKLPLGTKWIAFGGSYPGSLAAWLRAKYPHLIHASVSSSGPLLALADFRDYYAVVRSALEETNPDCIGALRTAKIQFDRLMEHRVGQQSIVKKFILCDPIDPTISNDIANLYENIASIFAGIVQYNKDNRNGSEFTVDDACDIMLNETLGLEINRLAEINKITLKQSKEKCLDFVYEKMINDLRNISWNSEMAEGMRQWTYQTCTEFGFFQSSSLNLTKDLFSDKFPVDFFIKQCSDIFGPKFDSILLKSGIDNTNTFYGGMDLLVDRIVYVHGSIDPWHKLGITKTLVESSPAIFIEGTAHCANMYPPSTKDLPQLVKAREQIEKLLEQWLK